MASACDIEIRPNVGLSPKERALARDSYVRAFETQFSDWTSIAKCCIDVERDRDWDILGFTSWNSWLMDAAPRSRSYIYLVVGRYKELSPDIPDEDLSQIPITSTTVLRKLSSAERQMSNIRQAAKQKPGKFIADLQVMAPGQHIEPIVEKKLKFELSAWVKIESAYEAYKLVDENASLETFLEWCVSEQAE